MGGHHGRQMPQSIRNQILIPLIAVQGLAVAILATSAAALAARRSEGQIISRLNEVIDTLGHSNFPYTQGVLDQMSGLSGAHFAVYGEDGRGVAATLQAPGVLPPVERSGRRLTQIDSLESFTTLQLDGTAYFAARLEGPAGRGARPCWSSTPKRAGGRRGGKRSRRRWRSARGR